MKQIIRGFDDNYVVSNLAEKIIQERLTSDEALKRVNWNVRGSNLKGAIRFYDGPVPEDLVKKALKMVEERNKE